MKKLMLFFLGVSSVGFAQELMPIFEDTINDDNILKISSFNYYSSNRFSNDLMDKFLFGGEITQDIKDRNSNRLKGYNALGLEAEQTIQNYIPSIKPFGKDNYGMIMTFSDNHFASSNIPPGLFNLGMYGNYDYQGDTLNFSLAHAQYQHYQKLSFGFYDKKTMSSVQIGYVAGSKGFNFRTLESSFYTHPDGDSITSYLSGEGSASERFYPYLAFTGGGFSVDINLNFLFENKKGHRQVVNFKVNNLGMIFWNQNTNLYSMDDSITYKGFEIHDIIEGTASTEVDFADTLGVTHQTGRIGEVLPLELIIQKIPDHGSKQKLQPIYGFKSILTTDFFPYFFGGVYYQPIENFSGSTRVSYGGFGGLKWGLNLNYWLKDKASFYLGSYDLIGFISKNYGMGRSLNFGANIKL